MQALWRAAYAAALVLTAGDSVSADDRSRAARADFQRHEPCPSTGAARGACPGFEVDHRIALCSGGADAPANMQWLSIAAHRQKTKSDVLECRRERAGSPR